MRVEEIDESGDEEEENGVDLYSGPSGQRFASDELRFTGIDMRSHGPRRRRPRNAYDEDTNDSEDDDEGSGREREPAPDMQLILREKEDLLVERALERMRRARELGKTNVKLTRAEIDALERAEQRQKLSAEPKAPKSKKAVPTRPKLDDRKRSGSDRSARNSPSMKAIEPRRKDKTSSAHREPAPLPYPVLSDQPYDPAMGALIYQPPGYYAPPPVRAVGSISRPGSHTASSHSLRRQHSAHTPPLAAYPHAYQHGRYLSNPDPYAARPVGESSRNTAMARPDPSEPNWEPRARPSSNVMAYPIDAYGPGVYPPPQGVPVPRFDPNDPRFASPPVRRVISDPPDVYSTHAVMYRGPPDGLILARDGKPATPVDEEDSDEDAGVQVEVLEGSDGEYGVHTRSSAVTGPSNRGRGSGQGKRGSGRRTR